MATPNCLAADCYDGEIEGIQMSWRSHAQQSLLMHAENARGNVETLKAATENLAYACAKRLGKARVRIMGLPYEAASNPVSSETRNDEPHISLKMWSGDWKVHIYVDGLGKGATTFDNMKMKRESVVKPGKTTYDTGLSIGTIPEFQTS